MLSYQHIYHAGNWADIHKHATLCALWTHLIKNKKNWHYIETHAGRGLYDLTSAEAQKTAEYKDGFERFKPLRRKNIFAPFYQALQTANPRYPGSPFCIVAHQGQHKISLCELNPTEISFLRKNFSGMKNISIYKEDGHEKSMALAAQNNMQSFVMIDPSYEVKSEYEQTAKTVEKILEQRPDAVVMIWHCRLAGQDFHQILETEFARYLQTKIEISNPPMRGMISSHLTIINAPNDFTVIARAIEKTLQKIF